MKKSWLSIASTIVITSMVLLSSSQSVSAKPIEMEPRIFVNNEEVVFNEVSPIIRNARTLIPLRTFSTALGLQTHWDPLTRTAILSQQGNDFFSKLHIQLGLPYILQEKWLSSGEKRSSIINIDSTAQIINDRTFLPLRSISQLFNYNVDWDSDLQASLLHSKQEPSNSEKDITNEGKEKEDIKTVSNNQSKSDTNNKEQTLNKEENNQVTKDTEKQNQETQKESVNKEEPKEEKVVTKQETVKQEPKKEEVTEEPKEQEPVKEEPKKDGKITSIPNYAITAKETEMFNELNKVRAEKDLEPFILDTKLSEVARIKAMDMVNNNYAKHNSPTYGSPRQMMIDFGFRFNSSGEIFAIGENNPKSIIQSWIKSPDHNAYIYAGDHGKVNAKIYAGVAKYKSDNGANFWVVLFYAINQ